MTPGSTMMDAPASAPRAGVDVGGAGLEAEPGASGQIVARQPRKSKFMDRFEGFVSAKTVTNRFWRWICSRIWLPIAFKSGITYKRIDANTFHAVLPFRRFNKNWYNAMAGAALLANSEIAGGMYIWGRVGRDYTVVCKNLSYKFLRPCFGPALYRVTPRGDLDALIATGKEFNLDVDLEVVQQIVPGKHKVERRVGRCEATFHVTPKTHHKSRRDKRGNKMPRDARRREG